MCRLKAVLIIIMLALAWAGPVSAETHKKPRKAAVKKSKPAKKKGKKKAKELSATKQKAKDLFINGVEAFAAENYPDALSYFQESYETFAKPNVLYNIGMCHRALFDFTSAINTFQRYLIEAGNDAPPDKYAQVEALIGEMESSLGKLTVTVNENGADVYIDAAKVGVSPMHEIVNLNAGTHVIEAKKQGFESEQKIVALKSGQQEAVDIMLIPLLPGAADMFVIEEVVTEDGKVVQVKKMKTDVDGKKKEKKKGGKPAWKNPWLWSVLSVVILGGGAAGVLYWQLGTGGSSGPDADWTINGR
ncbi:MAG: PEGA domain-containing protein [Pseudomonadota bacterium]